MKRLGSKVSTLNSKTLAKRSRNLPFRSTAVRGTQTPAAHGLSGTCEERGRVADRGKSRRKRSPCWRYVTVCVAWPWASTSVCEVTHGEPRAEKRRISFCASRGARNPGCQKGLVACAASIAIGDGMESARGAALRRGAFRAVLNSSCRLCRRPPTFAIGDNNRSSTEAVEGGPADPLSAGGWVLHQPPWSFGFDSQTRGTRENRRTLC